MLAIVIGPARFTELPCLNQGIAAVLAHVRASPAASPERSQC